MGVDVWAWVRQSYGRERECVCVRERDERGREGGRWQGVSRQAQELCNAAT